VRFAQVKKLSRDMAKVADVDETFAAVPGNREFMVRKTPLLRHLQYHIKMYHFTKTGSGQT
jgi:hypothetical protein